MPNITLPSQRGQPTWELTELFSNVEKFPKQGDWQECDYLSLNVNRCIELTAGQLEFLPWATTIHQAILGHLLLTLSDFIKRRDLGLVLFAPFAVKIHREKFRTPDVVYMSNANRQRRRNEYWDGADLVMEIVSEDDPERDLIQKREEYALAGIPEYWIVDPRVETITVLKLDGTTYAEHGCFKAGERATSLLLPGFEVDVTAAFEAGKQALG